MNNNAKLSWMGEKVFTPLFACKPLSLRQKKTRASFPPLHPQIHSMMRSVPWLWFWQRADWKPHGGEVQDPNCMWRPASNQVISRLSNGADHTEACWNNFYWFRNITSSVGSLVTRRKITAGCLSREGSVGKPATTEQGGESSFTLCVWMPLPNIRIPKRKGYNVFRQWKGLGWACWTGLGAWGHASPPHTFAQAFTCVKRAYQMCKGKAFFRVPEHAERSLCLFLCECT